MLTPKARVLQQLIVTTALTAVSHILNTANMQNARCPRYAIEGVTVDSQKVRIIFAQCNEKTEVVTVIDLDTEWSCDCPGDDKKYDNKN